MIVIVERCFQTFALKPGKNQHGVGDLGKYEIVVFLRL